MGIYVVFFIILLLGLLPKPKGSSRVYLLISTILIFVIIGLRDITVGIDTLSYVEDFMYYCRKNWSEIYRDAFTHKEPVFHLTVGLLSRVSNSYPFYLMFWAMFPTIALFSIFKDELKRCKLDIMLAIIVLFNLGIITFFQAGIRQTAAMSIILLSYKQLHRIGTTHFYSFLKDKHFYTFLFFLGMAFCFHNSVIIFIFALFVRNLKVRWWYIFIPVGIYILSSYVQLDMLTQMAFIAFQDQYAQYGTSYQSELSLSGFLMQVIIFLICFIPRNRVIKIDSQNQALYNFAILGLVFASLTGLIAEMYRLSFYWSMFYVLLLPRSLDAYNKRIREVGYVGFIIGSLVYLFFLSSANLTEFSFF